ncbi:MAG: hypothetical protein KUG69_12970, partial [Marinosulfonomonas sp.]|nr:hypothetical protein [Marinosulfonomonas sp.]
LYAPRRRAQHPVDSARQGGVLFGRDLAREQESGRHNWPLIVLEILLRASSRFSPERYAAPINGPFSFFAVGKLLTLRPSRSALKRPGILPWKPNNSETRPGMRIFLHIARAYNISEIRVRLQSSI